MKPEPTKQLISPVNWAVTWLALFSNEFLTYGWKAFLFLAVWVSFALSPLVEYLPIELTLLISWFLLALSASYFWHILRNSRPPKTEDILRQIEQANDLSHRPLRSLHDHLSEGSIQQPNLRIWQQYKQSLLEKVPSLSLGWSPPVMAKLDPYALRLLVLFCLIIFGISNPKPLDQLLKNSLWPSEFTNNLPLQIDAWVSPPVYTGLSTIVISNIPNNSMDETIKPSPLKTKQQGIISVIVGSHLTLQVNGPSKSPTLLINEEDSPINFESIGPTSHRLSLSIEKDGHYQVSLDGNELQSWAFHRIPDFKPEAIFAGSIKATNRLSLKIPYVARDDFGIQKISLRATKTSATNQTKKESEIDFSLVKSNGDKKEISSNHFLDLTAHPWAGLQVKLELLAFDALRQMAISSPQLVMLPQRMFNHPIARQIIAIRRHISASETDDFLIEGKRLISLSLKIEEYNNDRAFFLGLNMAARRLVAIDKEEQLGSTLDLLWKIALFLEEGDVSTALHKLQSAEKNLLEAINKNADADTIQQLLYELEMAMSEYLQAIANEPFKGEGIKQTQPQFSKKLMETSNLADMMKQLRELLKMGMTDAARDLLAQIQNIMQNLKHADKNPLSKEAVNAVEMLKEMEDIIQQQQNLMERSYNRAMGRDSDRGLKEGGDKDIKETNQDYLDNRNMKSDEDIERQIALRNRLNDLRKKYQSIMGANPPKELNNSDSAMDMAEESLELGSNHQATMAQSHALNALQKSLDHMEEAFIEKFIGQGNQAITNEQDSDGRGKDPFGRKVNNPANGLGGDDLHIPSKEKMGRARKIQQELRRRFNDKGRDEDERDYIERLLSPF